MRTYTPTVVERFLRNYLDIRHALEGGSQRLHDGVYNVATDAPADPPTTELPLGQRPGDRRAWPFREPRHAREPRDGKAKARAIQDLHCMCLDFERATRGMSDDDLLLIYRYHVFQTHTLDDLLVERGLSSRGSMQRRVFRAVARLAEEMERPAHGRA